MLKNKYALSLVLIALGLSIAGCKKNICGQLESQAKETEKQYQSWKKSGAQGMAWREFEDNLKDIKEKQRKAGCRIT